MRIGTDISSQKAASLLSTGEIIAYPTEGVWGLGCDPKNTEAIKKLINLKKRDPSKGLILVGSEINHFKEYVDVEKYGESMMEKWPGPHTWIVPCKPISELITGSSTSVALRLSNHKTIKEITEKHQGAIISTSANTEGHPAAKSKEEVRSYFKDVFMVKGSLGDLATSTPIQELVSRNWIRM